MRLLVVTAIAAERAAIAAAVPPDSSAVLLVGGVGPAASAAATSAALAAASYDLVLSAGIAGGFVPMSAGDIAVASSIVFADLGAETPDGFIPLPALGFGRDTYQVAPRLAVELADCTGGHMGTVLTVATVTGSAARADALAVRVPDALAEAMEGAGVAAAAEQHGVAFGEVRAISNAVGPRGRDAWRVSAAMDALGAAFASIVAGEWAS